MDIFVFTLAQYMREVQCKLIYLLFPEGSGISFKQRITRRNLSKTMRKSLYRWHTRGSKIRSRYTRIHTQALIALNQLEILPSSLTCSLFSGAFILSPNPNSVESYSKTKFRTGRVKVGSNPEYMDVVTLSWKMKVSTDQGTFRTQASSHNQA